ncbi:carbohydrate ABC transporter permease [Paenibacillus montanisoli]|uniref:Carbohydrate ABC transporter permease n=1 Tax=Paenibacillus montanisoli TaxID=2081970 RepID=A0A328U594_9BACL|nr:carbohydrate ABC transporter permease [Paenibacillus montanisoli]RAP76581.1 carbohydrate ABC transporter permease [Paenibacillus montanisoli]
MDTVSIEVKNSTITKRNKIKVSIGERTFDLANVLLILLLCAITLYPFWYVLVLSLNEGKDAARGPIWFWPREFTLQNYEYVIRNPYIVHAFLITVTRAVIGSLVSIGVMFLAAYSLSKRNLAGRKTYLYFLMIPLFIGGNVVTNYVVMAKLGMLNNFLVYILPGAFSFFFMIIIRTFIEQLPESLEESAMLDGAGHYEILKSIIAPLSKPIIAAMLFFSVVSHWLDLSTNLLYVTDRSLYVVQYVLYMVVLSSSPGDLSDITNVAMRLQSQSSGSLPTPEVLKMATLIAVTLPLLFIYPFFQKYFVKGMLVGAIKA